MSVSVHGLGGSTGFDLLSPLPVFIKFDDSMFLVLGLNIVMKPQLYGAVINFLHGCSLK